MTVSKRGDRGGRWVYDFWANGVRYRGYCDDPDTGQPATSKKAALELEALIRRRVRQHGAANLNGSRPDSFTLGQAMVLHLRRQHDSTEMHRSNLKLYAGEILRFFGVDRPVAEIDATAINAYRQFASQQKLKIWAGGPEKRRDPDKLDAQGNLRWWRDGDRVRSPASVNHYLACLRGALGQAHKARDPITGQPMLPFPPTVEKVRQPKRIPRPIPDQVLADRLERARPWVRDAGELARLFGLRHREALGVTIDHVDRHDWFLRLEGDEQKGGRTTEIHGGAPGRQLLRRLVDQARARGQHHLVTWPGPEHFWDHAKGRKIPRDAWRPLKSLRRAWASTADDGLPPHRFHDVRARYITHIAGSASAALTRQAARHRDQATTDRYIELAAQETRQAVEKAMRRRPKLAAGRR
jgi:hypothetical protein